MKIKVGILNAGAWGTAMGKTLAEKGYAVQMWDYFQEVVTDINQNHTNTQFLLGVDLPKNLTASTDIQEVALDKDYLLISTPSMFIIPTIKNILTVPNIMEGQTLIGVLSKGFIPSAQKLPKLILDSLEDYLPGFYKGNLVYISGPSHAEEVSRGKLTGLVSASLNGKNSIKFRELLGGSTLMVFSSFDVVGVQICAATKNVIALAFGMMDAAKELTLSIGDNTESLLLAAGLNEIQILGRSLGATHAETFTSIAGVGDLDVTCRSQYGRNRRFGREIILNHVIRPYKSLDDLLNNLNKIGYLPEGAAATKYVNLLAQEHGLKLPISSMVYAILNKEVEPFAALKQMLKGLPGSASRTTVIT